MQINTIYTRSVIQTMAGKAIRDLRGGGELLGTRQSGFDEFCLADLSYHKDLLYTAHKDAQMIIAADPLLQTPRGRALRVLLYLFEKDTYALQITPLV